MGFYVLYWIEGFERDATREGATHFQKTRVLRSGVDWEAIVWLQYMQGKAGEPSMLKMLDSLQSI